MFIRVDLKLSRLEQGNQLNDLIKNQGFDCLYKILLCEFKFAIFKILIIFIVATRYASTMLSSL